MKLEWAAIIGMALLADVAAAGNDPALATKQQKMSYGMGVSMARSFRRQGVELDADLLAKGLKDEISGGKLLMSDADLRAAMAEFQAELTKKQARPAKTPAQAKEEGEAFLAENAKKEGVVTLSSGLQYQVLRAGEGKTPQDGDKVVCHYRGTFVDGTEFDSSYARARPGTFELARMIPGFREALKLMPVGSKWRIFIPAKLAYGERGMPGRKKAPGKIGPNSTLIYEAELLGVQSGRASPKTAAAQPPAAQEN